ncbi:microfibril-associated glycoprotein 4-like [Saccostrea cucullata]|uniref:microfibril-associated glycoprotein 4-like n=1 Tax=Saccostrea cuccullata TaxID=36930 RepID=UPI002ED59FF2
MCGLGCTYFGVNLQRKKCRVYGGCHSTNSTVAEVGWRYYNPDSEVLENFRPKDCKSLLAVGFTASCIYTIYPWYNNPVEVFCDMDTKDGGWTAIQRRVNGSIDFDRFWNEYKEGFGSAYSSYWIGNDVIHQLTMNRPSLYVSITLTNGTTLYQQYKEFSVSSETDNYRLYLAGPTEGTLGDSMLDTGYPNYDDLSGMYFSTHDRDNDRWIYNCADFYNRKGGWWFNGCHRAFLNGRWSLEYWVWPWYPTLTDGREIKETVMMIKTL